VRQACWPVLRSVASIQPRMPNSPPAEPMMTRSRNDERGERHVSPRAGSAALRSHTTSPVAAIEREDAAVEGDRDHFVFPERDAAIIDAAAGDIAGPGAVDAGSNST